MQGRGVSALTKNSGPLQVLLEKEEQEGGAHRALVHLMKLTHNRLMEISKGDTMPPVLALQDKVFHDGKGEKVAIPQTSITGLSMSKVQQQICQDCGIGATPRLSCDYGTMILFIILNVLVSTLTIAIVMVMIIVIILVTAIITFLSYCYYQY